MNTRFFRSFATELMKTAGDLLDADIRRLLADRRGEEYLPGGELEANDQNIYFPSLAAGTLSKTADLAAGMIQFKEKAKEDGPYQTVRDWGWRGVQGAAAGSGINHLIRNMRGKTMRPKNYRRGAAIGASIALGDRVWRHRKDIEGASKKLRRRRKKKEKTAFANPSPTPFRSPASALSAARKTGGFKSNVIHDSGSPSSPVQIGKKFRIPTPGAH